MHPPMLERCPTSMIERFQADAVIGVGGAAKVLSAWDATLERQVALKIASMEGAPGFAADMLDREFEVLSSVSHPSLPDVYDFRREGHAAVLVMELLDGVSLDVELERNGPLDADVLSLVATRLLEGLTALHAAGYVHLDIKPGNLVIDASGRVVLIDMGLCQRIEEVSLGSGQISGTLDYLAPEQLYGAPLGVFTDLYQVGATLFELATGIAPYFQCSDVLNLASCHLEGILFRAHHLNPNIGFLLSRLIDECLSSDFDVRPSSCAEALERLSGYDEPLSGPISLP